MKRILSITALLLVSWLMHPFSSSGQGNQPLNAQAFFFWSWADPYEIQLVNTTEGEYNQVEWNMGDGTIFNSDIGSYTYAAEGEYIVTLKVSNTSANQSDSTYFIVFVEENGCTIPFATYPTSEPGKLDFVAFTGWSIPPAGVSVSWDFGDGTTEQGSISALGTQHSYANLSQTYEVVLQVSYSGCQSSYTSTVDPTQSAPCIADFSYSPGSEDGMTIQFENLSSSDSNGELLYFWDFNTQSQQLDSSDVSNEENPSYTYFDNGDYIVELTIQDPVTQCVDSKTMAVTVDGNPPLRANFTYFFSSVIQGSEFDVFLIPFFTGDVVTYEFDMGNGEILSQEEYEALPGPYTYSSGGAFEICATVFGSNGEQERYCLPISLPFTGCNSYFLYSQLEEENSYRFSPVFTGVPQPILTYQWIMGDGTAPIFTDEPYLDYTFDGAQTAYTVQLTTSRIGSEGEVICSGFYFETIDITLNVNEQDKPIQLANLYPNPNNGEFVLDISSKVNEQIVIQVMDLTGKVMHTENIALVSSQSQQIPMQIANLSKGMYMLSIAGTQYTLTKRFIVQ
jgi:PKD repeat protein